MRSHLNCSKPIKCQYFPLGEKSSEMRRSPKCRRPLLSPECQEHPHTSSAARVASREPGGAIIEFSTLRTQPSDSQVPRPVAAAGASRISNAPGQLRSLPPRWCTLTHAAPCRRLPCAPLSSFSTSTSSSFFLWCPALGLRGVQADIPLKGRQLLTPCHCTVWCVVLLRAKVRLNPLTH